MALSRKVKERIAKNKYRKMLRVPSGCIVIELDHSTKWIPVPDPIAPEPFALQKVGRGVKKGDMILPKIFLYSPKGPVHGPV